MDKRSAVGFIEAEGLPAAIAAADAAVKSANVQLVGRENSRGGGFMTIKIAGDVGAVKAAIEAARVVSDKVRNTHSVLVIPRPAEGVANSLVWTGMIVGQETGKPQPPEPPEPPAGPSGPVEPEPPAPVVEEPLVVEEPPVIQESAPEERAEEPALPEPEPEPMLPEPEPQEETNEADSFHVEPVEGGVEGLEQGTAPVDVPEGEHLTEEAPSEDSGEDKPKRRGRRRRLL